MVTLKAKDKGTGRLNAGINASVLSIPLQSGNGANFPQPYTGSATSVGSITTLNSTGIGASGVAVGDYIHNVTDDSWATIETVSANSIITSKLKGGTLNLWSNSDVWRVNEFIVTIAVIDANGDDTSYEEALISNRSTDTLTVPTGGRGYNSTTPQSFSSGDYVQLRVTAPYYEEVKKFIRNVNVQTDTNTDGLSTLNANLVSTANAKGASLIGIEDAGGNFTGTTVEAALTEIDTRLDAAVTLTQIGLYGDGNDGVPTWTSGASLNPSTEKRYTTATLPVSQTLTVSSVNTPLVIHNSSNVTINGTVDMNGKGGAAGNGTTGAGTGSNGTAGNSLISGWTNGAGTGASSSAAPGGGGAGASFDADGGAAATGGTEGLPGTKIDPERLAFLSSILRGVVCGAGGGGGSANSSGGAGNAGAGGAGGGALVWLIGGNLTLGAASIIRANGANGTAGSATGAASGQSAGGGGGGGGGAIIILVAGSITDGGVTVSATGGTGAQSHDNGSLTNNEKGGDGGAGKVIIYSLSTGTLITA